MNGNLTSIIGVISLEDPNTQAAVIASVFVTCLLSSALFASLLFGMLPRCGGFGCGGCDCMRGVTDCVSCHPDDWACCIAARWAFYRCCPCCFFDYRKWLRDRANAAREELLATDAAADGIQLEKKR